LDAEHDGVDGSTNEYLPATTLRKAGLGQEEEQSSHEGEQTHLAGSGVHALDLVPNPKASGLIARPLLDYLLCI